MLMYVDTRTTTETASKIFASVLFDIWLLNRESFGLLALYIMSMASPTAYIFDDPVTKYSLSPILKEALTCPLSTDITFPVVFVSLTGARNKWMAIAT